MERPVRIAIAGGGTGGHVFPAISIAEAIRSVRKDAEFLFFGTAGRIEERVVPAKGYPFRTIWISGFHRSLRPGNLLFPLKLVVSLAQSWKALRSFRPDVVVGTGGYVCGPVLYMASRMGIPTVVHESNSYPGVTTRLLAGRVDLVLAGFGETARWLPQGVSMEVVGTPVRAFHNVPDKGTARAHLGFRSDAPLVVVTGGSQGAASINRAIDQGLSALVEAGLQLLWQTGRGQEAQCRLKHAGVPGLQITGFIDDVATAFAAADIVVSRSGASTLAELAALGAAAVLVPYPWAAGDHQMKNARAMEAAGAAVVIADTEAETRLITEIIRLRSDETVRTRMSAAMRQVSKPDAAAVIAGRVLSLSERT